MTENQARAHHNNTVSAGERRLSLFILGVLALTAAAMLIIQADFDPGEWTEQTASVQPDRPGRDDMAASGDQDQDMADGLDPISTAQQYDARTLSDKIDGKADLYLNAGFKGLSSRRFALTADRSRWMERYVYDMGGLRNAFAVFSAQRRANARLSALTPYAYQAGNGLFFVHGTNYVEIIAAEDSPEVQKAMNALAAAFIASHAVPAQELAELKLLPPDHRINSSTALESRSAFGIEGLDEVFTAAYAAGQSQALAFVSKRRSRGEAESLAEKFYAFWLEYGGEESTAPADPSGIRIVKILDNYEICMVHGDYLFGVHEAVDLTFGLDLVKQLQRNIAGGTHER